MSNLAHVVQKQPSRDLSPLEEGLSKQYNDATNRLSATFEKTQVAKSSFIDLEKELNKLDQAYVLLIKQVDDSHLTDRYNQKRERIIQDLVQAQRTYQRASSHLREARQELKNISQSYSSQPEKEEQTEDPYLKLKERMLEQTDKVFEREIAEKALLRHDKILAEKKWNIVKQLKRTYKAIEFAYESLLFAEG